MAIMAVAAMMLSFIPFAFRSSVVIPLPEFF
jgi:hypothetical protein